MSKYLIVFAHPSHSGHNGYLLAKVQKILEEKKADFSLIDLYAIGYDPVLKLNELYSAGNKEINAQNLEFQEQIKSSDKLIFIYPIWWQSMPAILKGFFDRVITGGFGFKYINGIPVGLLKGKKAAIFATTGSPTLYNRFSNGHIGTRVLKKSILSLCGVKAKTFIIGNARKLENNQKKLDKIADSIIDYLT